MEGPTPVSALIHAATMVTAGVFVVARSAVLYELAPVSAAIVAVVGVLTALLAAVIAIAQTDIKRVLAYSTISQLGYMVLGVGVGAYAAGLFHLTTHAFFKALLFLGAGSVIHAMSDEQDMRRMGGLRKLMPITFITMAVGWLAISGIFPFAGFWSKDEILAATYKQGGPWLILWGLGLLVALLTAFYMTRLFVMTFLGERRFGDDIHPHESPRTMTIPLIVLAFFTVVAGGFNTPFRLAVEHFLEPSFEGVPKPTPLDPPVIIALAVTTLLIAVVGIVLAWRRYHRDELPAEDGPVWRNALAAFGVDDFYGRVIVAPGKAIATWFSDVVDPKVIDGAARGVARVVVDGGEAARTAQTGQVRWYASVIAIGGALLVVLFLVLGGAF
jgi:NADH-quinone oxidoreductase subunit L